MTATGEELLTFGQIVNRTGQPAHRVRYAVDSRGIEPVGRLGNYRVFDLEALAKVEAVLRELDGDRPEVRAAGRPRRQHHAPVR